MADSILRLRVQSDEYDNKLKRATEQLTRYADGCRKAGGTLQYVDEGVLEFTRSLGKMETSATSARGQLAEMTKAFTEWSVRYNKLTDEEKNGEFGKALSQSLDQLKVRIQNSKTELDDINKSLNGGGGLSGALDNIAGKFGMSVQSLASWGTALAAARGALEVAKDAFFASEATVDEWGRVMDSSKSLYEGFLTALNTGDISGYLSRIDDIVQAARTAYNELDRLGTMKTIQAPQMSAQQTENERMRMMIQTGRYIAPIDGRKSTMQNGQLLTPEQIQRLEQQLQNGMQKVVTLVGNEVAQTGKAIDAVYNRQAQELGMSLKEFRKGTSSMAEFDKRLEGYQKYEQWRKDNSFTDAWGNRQVRPGNPYEEYKKWSTFRVDGDRYNDLVKLIQQRDQQAGQAYNMQSQAYRTMNRAEGVTLRQIMGGGSGSGKTTTKTPKTEEQLNNDEIQKLTQEYIKASNDRRKAIEGEIKTLQDRNAEIKRLMEAAQGKAAPDGSLKALSEEMSKLQQERQLLSDPIDIELHDQAIREVQDEIDHLNGKKVEIELTVDDRTPFEQLKDSLKIEIAEENMQVDTTTLQMLMKTAIQNGIDGLDPNFSALQEKMRDGMNIPDETWQALQDEINEKLKELGIEPIKIDFKTGKINESGKTVEKSWQSAARAVQAVGSAMESIEDPAAKIAGTVAQAIANIALGYSQAMLAPKDPVSWIAFGAAGLAQMLAMMNAIHSSTGYANGGIVKGNSYSGDNIPAMIDGGAGGFAGLNAGEVVLNASMQNMLAQNLQGSGLQNLNVSGEISGETIKIVLNRHLKRSGQGELVTW